ncbi:23175_t:CDS:2 [Entrophospora sp. SA101]|nr:23175_t:CDS:2 [Entrophospora sp. SA101]
MVNINKKNSKLKQLSLILDPTKQDQLTKLLEKTDQLEQAKQKAEQEIKTKKAKLANLKNVYAHYRGAQKELASLGTTGSKNTYPVKGQKFLGDGTGTNEYSWETKITNHYPTTYTQGATTYDYSDNLYSQAIRLLAKVVYEVANIDKAKFSAKYIGTDKTTLENAIDHIKEQGTAIKQMNQKGGQELTKKTYDLPQTYTKEQTGTTNTPYTANPLQFASVFALLAKLNTDALISEVEDKNKITQTYTSSELADYGIKQLFNDLRDQTTFRTHWELPENPAGVETLIDELEEEKSTGGTRNAQLKADIEAQQEEVITKQTELITQAAEIKKFTAEILTKQRAELKKYNLAQGFIQTTSQDNRRPLIELHQIEQLLSNIRCLVNDGDETLPSDQTEEETAYTAVQQIIEKVNKLKCRLFAEYAYVSEGKYDNQQAITKIKEDYQLIGAKLIQLTERDSEALRDIEAALKQDTKKDGQDAFTNTASVNTLLKKICVLKTDGTIDKVNDDFLAFIKGKDDKLTSLTELIKEKDPAAKEVDSYELTAEDKKAGGNFEKFLYQTAIGKITEALLTKPVSENNGTGTPNTEPETAETKTDEEEKETTK